MIEAIIFWAFAFLSFFAALGVVMHRSIIYSALCLLVVFMSIAGFFVLNNADFLAVAQVIVYAVGMTIIMLFGIMFTGEQAALQRVISPRRLTAYTIVMLFGFSIFLVGSTYYPYVQGMMMPEVKEILQQQGTTALLGKLLFTEYVLPFEVVSILLLMAMIGAIVLSKKQFTDASGESLYYEINKSTHLRPEAADWEKSVKAGGAQEPPPSVTSETREPVGV